VDGKISQESLPSIFRGLKVIDAEKKIVFVKDV